MYEQLRDSFLAELPAFYEKGEMPKKASLNMRRALTEHSKRLQAKGIRYREDFISTIDERPRTTAFESSGFVMTNCVKHCNAITDLTDGRSSLRCDDASDDIISCHVIDRKDKTADDGSLEFICPNCGHRAIAADFVDGCPMCSTHFEINDLYPSINTYYTMPWPMPKSNFVEVALNRAKIIGIIGGLLIGALALVVMLIDGKGAVLTSIVTVIAALLGGWCLFIVSYFICQAAVSVQAVAGVAKLAANTLDLTAATHSRRDTENGMRPFDPSFNFDVFEGRIISSLRTIAYSDDRMSCSLYAGQDPLTFMDDLVDIRYRGACRFNKIVPAGDYVHAFMTAYLDNVYYRDGKFIRCKENFMVEMVRRKDARTSAGFTAYSVNCKTCGGTFDAVLHRNCPFCGNAYELAGQDWIVLKIVKEQTS